MIAGHKVGQRYAISEKQGTIGRGPSNAIQVIDAEVSRVHCRYQIEGNRLEVADLQSANGTFVNGRTVERYKLNDGDQIKVGSTVFEVKIDEVPGEMISNTEFSIHGKFPASDLPSSLSYFPRGKNFFSGGDSNQDSADAADSVRVAQVLNDMSFIYDASLVTSSKADRQEMLNELIDLIFNWVTADRCGVLLRDAGTGKFAAEAMRSRSLETCQDNLVISQSIVDYVCKHRVGILTSNALEDQRLPKKDSIKRIGVREAICVPINGRDELLGVIYIDALDPSKKPETDRFNKNNLKLMIAIGLQIGFAIENEQYFKKRLEQQRLVTIGQTTTSLSHHLKNVLQGVNGGAHLIESGLKADDLQTIKTGWAIVNRNQGEISKMVNDMLLFSKPYDPHLAQADLNEVITQVVNEIEPSLARRNIQYDWSPTPGPVLLRIDPRGIHWALFNLINSCAAACHGLTHGTIKVTVALTDDENVLIAIEDNGQSVQANYVEDVFSPTTSDPGHSMNPVELAVSRKIILGHNGEVILKSSESDGNLFHIQLPLEQPGSSKTE